MRVASSDSRKFLISSASRLYIIVSVGAEKAILALNDEIRFFADSDTIMQPSSSMHENPSSDQIGSRPVPHEVVLCDARNCAPHSRRGNS
jgi:hypothetical protein